MGDYTKLIVNCNVKASKEEIELALKETGIIVGLTSAYHCGGEVLHMRAEGLSGRVMTELTLVIQAKYGRGINAFLEWLAPRVRGGSGPSDLYAIEQSEYFDTPNLYFQDKKVEDQVFMAIDQVRTRNDL